jgi:excisionase family DNA binding protein
MPEPLATKEQVAEYLGVHPGTLDRWVGEKEGPAYVKVGLQRRYDWNDVRAWVESRKVQHTSTTPAA